jgi:hypothetical protein
LDSATEAAAREAAATNFVGTFTSDDGLNSSISFKLIPDRQGLRITQLVHNSTDMLDMFAAQLAMLLGVSNI